MSIVDVIVSFLVLAGAGFALLSSIGLARFPDLLTRLHGPSKATTLGIGSLLLASMVAFSHDGALSVHELVITMFLVITTPVGAQFLARAALRRDAPSPARETP